MTTAKKPGARIGRPRKPRRFDSVMPKRGKGRPNLTPQFDADAMLKVMILAEVSDPMNWRPDWHPSHPAWPSAAEAAIRLTIGTLEGVEIPSRPGRLLVRSAHGGLALASSRIDHLSEYFAAAGGAKDAIEAWRADPLAPAARIPALADGLRFLKIALNSPIDDRARLAVELYTHARTAQHHGAPYGLFAALMRAAISVDSVTVEGLRLLERISIVKSTP